VEGNQRGRGGDWALGEGEFRRLHQARGCLSCGATAINGASFPSEGGPFKLPIVLWGGGVLVRFPLIPQGSSGIGLTGGIMQESPVSDARVGRGDALVNSRFGLVLSIWATEPSGFIPSEGGRR